MTEELYLRFITVLAACLLVPSVVFFAQSISNPKMRYWKLLAAGAFAIFVASVLIALQSILPPIVPQLIANGLVGVGYYLNLRAVRALEHGKTPARFDGWLLGALLALVAAVYLWANVYEYRVMAVSFAICAFSAVIAVRVRAQRRYLNRLGGGVVVIVAGGNALLTAGRGISALLRSDQYVLSLDLWDPLFFVGSIVVLVGFFIGFFIIGASIIAQRTEALLDHERDLTRRLNAAIADQKNLQKLLIHEIKRPINAMSTLLQTHVSDELALRDKARAEHLLHLLQEAANCLEGIGEYEELSALFERPDTQSLALAAIADDLRTKWRVTVHLSSDLQDCSVIADSFLIDIALGNLIENGQKFGRNIENLCVRIRADQGSVVFDVEDDGPGIPRNEWAAVWGKFYRVGGVGGNPATGSGLGLHAVMSIAQVHSGFAHVLSQSPSCIRLGFPLAAGGSDAVAI
jgi:signal transduction histidine kinase